jgi:hypothetical protein
MLKKLSLDLRGGGLGDMWMRLVGFHAAAGVRSNLLFHVAVTRKIESFAMQVFGDRLQFVSTVESSAIVYSTRGLRHLFFDALRGTRFASPYGRSVIKDWNRWRFRDRLNSFFYFLSDIVGIVYSPPWSSFKSYQGYSEVVLIPSLRDISINEFNFRIIQDHRLISERVSSIASKSLPEKFQHLKGRIVVFPSGTGRQFVPVEWAQSNLPNAIYAFHQEDPEHEKWLSAGLQTTLYKSPEEIAALGLISRVAVSTDSFPSHVLQYSGCKLVILITGTAKYRVVSPAFKGRVVDAVASCHPCPHLARGSFHRCMAGHEVCVNWNSPQYTTRIMNAIDSLHQ